MANAVTEEAKMPTRRASVLCSVLFVSVMMFVVSQASAVVVDMTVKDTAGAVPDMEITFTPEDPNLPTTTGRTDTQGKVVDRDGKAVVLPPGKYGIRAKGHNHVTYKDTVTIGPGDRTSISIIVDPIMAWMVQSPPCSLCFGLGAGYYGQWAEDVKLQPGETEIIRIPGMDPIILKDTSAGNRFNWDINSGTAHIPIGISTFHAGNWRFYPALTVQAGGADLNIDAIRKVDGVKQFLLHGSGAVVGAGGSVILTCPNCSLYFGAGYDYWTLVDAEMERDPCPFSTFPNCRATAEASSHSHSIWGRVGLNLPFLSYRFSPYGGIRGTWQTSDVKQHVSRDVPGVGNVTNDISQTFERDTVEGIAGVDAHFWGPFFGRFETTFNGSDVSVLVKFIYGLSWVDP
jgi:hypothetical protein